MQIAKNHLNNTKKKLDYDLHSLRKTKQKITVKPQNLNKKQLLDQFHQACATWTYRKPNLVKIYYNENQDTVCYELLYSQIIFNYKNQKNTSNGSEPEHQKQQKFNYFLATLEKYKQYETKGYNYNYNFKLADLPEILQKLTVVEFNQWQAKQPKPNAVPLARLP